MDLSSILTRRLIAPAWAAWERSPYLRHYRELQRTQFDTPEVVAARQWQALRGLLAHACETVPYYRQRYASSFTDPAQIQDLDAFRALPLLSKSDIRAAGNGLLSSKYRGRYGLTRRSTSGSTGVSLEIWIDEPATQHQRACTLRSDEWSGWRMGEPVAMIWGNPEYLKRGWRGRLRNALLDRARYLDTLKMDGATMERFARQLASRPPSLIFGHAHSVYLFAECVRQRKLGPIRPKGIITSAMVLHDWQRTTIEDVFACKVTNRYGCEEVSLIACECERHAGLHVNADGIFLELIRDGRPAQPGEPGSVVVTDLRNRAMPLIRYQVGDVATWSQRQCDCGRTGMPLLVRIEGREADYVTTAHGELISGISLTENFAMLVPGIAQIQIVQESLRHFHLRIVKAPDFNSVSAERIASLVRERFGDGVEHTCEYVDEIAKEPSGKYRFCISKVPNAFQSPNLVAVES